MEEKIQPESLTFEQQKWQQEVIFLREELSLKKREIDLRELEFAENKKKGDLSRWTSPLAVSILTVAFAGFLNVVSVLISNKSQNQLESDKHNNQLRVDSDKSTRDVFSKIIEITDHNELCRRMKLVDDIKFTATPAFASSIQLFLLQECQKTATTQPAPNPRLSVEWSSEWLSGGHSQSEQCKIGQEQIQEKYPGRTVTVRSSGEDSRKDIVGRVSYRYHCSFDII